MLALVALFAWPAVLSVAHIVAGSTRERLSLVAVYFAGLLLLGALALVRSDALSAGQLVVPCSF